MKYSHAKMLVLLGLLGATSMFAQLSPGPLSAPHAHLSGISNCLNCHTWGNSDFREKCLNCHTPIQTRIDQKSGYHGHLDEQNCVECHPDHVKEDFKMVHWDPSQKEFDHSQTGYKIVGKHGDLKCQDCHKKALITQKDIQDYARSTPTRDVLSTTFLGLGNNCSDCHADVHNREFVDKKCQDCHGETGWLEIRDTFDHDKRTDYPLRGAHKKVKCEQCHKEKQSAVGKYQSHRFTGLAFNLCTNCHEDKHKGSFGTDCLQCHSLTSFKSADRSKGFDHEKSRFPLLGKHKAIKCEACHKQKNQYLKLDSFDQCMDCHEDYHKGEFLRAGRDPACDLCHDNSGFSPSLYGIEKHQKTRFPLEGSHLAQPCISCHKPQGKSVYFWDKMSCENCHKNIHGPQFAAYFQSGDGCKSCHTSTAWNDLLFDHQRTKFPLSGKHADIGCERCHKSNGTLVEYTSTATECRSCHKTVHAEQFVRSKCSVCHGPATWKIAAFDHTTLTQYPLDGQHKDLSCGQCHKFERSINTIRFKPIAHRCQDCHGFGDFAK